MKTEIIPYRLHFKRPAGTSRGTITSREVWFLTLEEKGNIGIGECAPIAGLSAETPDEARASLQHFVQAPDNIDPSNAPSSVRFAIEMARRDLETGGEQIWFDSDFTRGQRGMLINGLVWLGEREFMHSQIEEKLAQGCRCIKLKIGALDFDSELALLKAIRNRYSADEVTLRVDANGAFAPEIAESRLAKLAELNIHSIEQPIAAGNWHEMTRLCALGILSIALDEELIGVDDVQAKVDLLDTIKPQYLVLKPSLHGGFSGCEQWIRLAKERRIGWWVTSYLESNVGLNALSQWVAKLNNSLHHGLGTGQLYTNNIASPLAVRGERLFYQPGKILDLSALGIQ